MTDTPDRPKLQGHHLALAALIGLLMLVPLFRSPWWASLPPLIYPPWIPLDLRFLLPAITLTVGLVLGHRSSWPGPAVTLPGLTVGMATTAHLHASAAFGFVNLPFAQPGTRVDLLALAFTIASVLLSLRVAMEIASAHAGHRLTHAGLDGDRAAKVEAYGLTVANRALVTAGLAVAILALALRIVDQFTGGQELPLAEIVALAVVVALGAILLGLGSLRAEVR